MRYCIYSIKPSFQKVFYHYPELFVKLLSEGRTIQLQKIVSTINLDDFLKGAKRFFEDDDIKGNKYGVHWLMDERGQSKYWVYQISFGIEMNDYKKNPLFYYYQRYFQEVIVIDEFHSVSIVKVKK